MAVQPRTFVAKVPGARNLTSDEISLTDILKLDTFNVTNAQANLEQFIDFISPYLSSVGQVVPTIAALTALEVRPQAVLVEGFYAAGDGGGGIFRWAEGSTTTALVGMVINPTTGDAGRYFRQYVGAVNPRWTGAKGDGATNDSAAFTAAFSIGAAVQVTKGTYPVKDLSVTGSTTCPGLFSQDGGTITPASGSDSETILITVTKSNFSVRGMTFTMPISVSHVTPPACNRALLFSNNADASNWEIIDNNFTGGYHGAILNGVFHSNVIRGNRATSTWREAFATQAPVSLEMTDNIVVSCANGDNGASGALGIGYSGALQTMQDLIISRNIVRDCGFSTPGSEQEALDCFTGALRSLIIADNHFDNCGNGGIELKTLTSALTPDVYTNISITGNQFRMVAGLDQQVGIGMNISTPYPAAGKAGRVLIEGNLFVVDTMVAALDSYFGISAAGYESVTITGNYFLNLARGIEVSAIHVTGDTARDWYITGNAFDTAGIGIHTAGTGTLTGLHIAHNTMRSGTRAIQLDSSPVNAARITDNYIESTAEYAVELRDVHDSSVIGNEIRAALAGILSQGTACTAVEISANSITTSGGGALDACVLSTGTGWTVFNNTVSVPITKRAISGAGTYTAANNVRGMFNADPGATRAASLGDVFLNSTPATVQSWVCTVAGNAGAATYKAVALT